MIDHVNGDYFIDCGLASQSFLRAAFGIWISIYAAVVAYCVRSVFRSRLITHLLSNNSSNRQVNLWVMSPATTPSEVFQLRELLVRATRRGNFTYTTVSLFCVIATVVSAASTTIANHTVVSHPVIRRRDVPGRLVQSAILPLTGLEDRVTLRAEALDRARAPYNQLFDFMPDNGTNWVFVPEEWNNTWLGECAFHKYSAVELVVLSSISLLYQDMVPTLGTFIPTWATLDRTKQGYGTISSPQGQETNRTGACRDCLITYVFGSAPYSGNESLPTTNISFANILLHNIGYGGNETYFMNTSFKSDVHVVECTFNNSSPSEDQAKADEGLYDYVAQAVTKSYTTTVAETSAQGQEVVQPTAEEMIRYWQAFQVVSHGYYIHPVSRTLSVSVAVVQIRLSVVAITIITFVLALTAAAIAHFSEPLDKHGKRVNLPKSQLDWMVEAARHNRVAGDHPSYIDFAKEHEDLFYAVSTTRQGLSRSQITSNTSGSVTLPFLGYFNYHSLQDKSGGVSASSSPTTQPFVGDFDPYSLYDNCPGPSPHPTLARNSVDAYGGKWV